VPRIVRPMIKDPEDGLPKVGAKFCCLGVRCPRDVTVDAAGVVAVTRAGMSVSACWRHLPGPVIPEELDDGFNGASGKGMAVYVHGDGAFAEGAVSEHLEMVFKEGRATDGVVRPVAPVALEELQRNLEATRAGWVEDAS